MSLRTLRLCQALLLPCADLPGLVGLLVRAVLSPYPPRVAVVWKGEQVRPGEVRPVRGRFAPSPTGALHLGHAQTLLLGWLQIRALGGSFVLRIEDIDTARNRAGAIEAIYRDMEWLGFDWDEGPLVGGPAGSYLQSERNELYDRCLEQLAEQCYPCSCSRADVREAAGAPEGGEIVYPGTCRSAPGRPGAPTSQRLRVPVGDLSWHDLCLGLQCDDPSQLCGDFIVRGKGGTHVYQLACVADDIAMGITHVLRGEDLLSSTSRQILLYRGLDADVPLFAHTPLRRDEDGQRLAKRRGSPALAALRADGAEPRLVVGGLAADLGILDSVQGAAPAELIEPFRAAFPGLVRRDPLI